MNSAILSGSVVTGNDSSFVESVTWSSAFEATLSSEHTGRNSNPAAEFVVHSATCCDSNVSEGTSTSVSSLPIASSIHSDVNVFPVPHAMIS